jgi:hypothetical protein
LIDGRREDKKLLRMRVVDGRKKSSLGGRRGAFILKEEGSIRKFIEGGYSFLLNCVMREVLAW